MLSYKQASMTLYIQAEILFSNTGLNSLVWFGRVGSVLNGLEQLGTVKPKCRMDGWDGISLTSLTTRSPDGDKNDDLILLVTVMRILSAYL